MSRKLAVLLASSALFATGCLSDGRFCVCALFPAGAAPAAATPEPVTRQLPPVAATPTPAPSRRIVLRGVLFDFDSDRLQPQGIAILDEWGNEQEFDEYTGVLYECR